MLAHHQLLVRPDFQIGTRKGRAQKDESRDTILGKVGNCVACVELSGLEKPSRAGEAPPLVAD